MSSILAVPKERCDSTISMERIESSRSNAVAVEDAAAMFIMAGLVSHGMRECRDRGGVSSRSVCREHRAEATE